ncbi:translation initiation factor IF-2-like [Aquila chrysaetos chrysaetos]|uniref:translation initiation factor IF-2-like n=1 Tax=Aquila chrysaetos chrysaetos TaxID=223781 RepID=UPI0011772F39|nr:translation initiation factor IF-2-like [Aquila chrysaetos chrysaetos]
MSPSLPPPPAISMVQPDTQAAAAARDGRTDGAAAGAGPRRPPGANSALRPRQGELFPLPDPSGLRPDALARRSPPLRGAGGPACRGPAGAAGGQGGRAGGRRRPASPPRTPLPRRAARRRGRGRGQACVWRGRVAAEPQGGAARAGPVPPPFLRRAGEEGG